MSDTNIGAFLKTTKKLEQEMGSIKELCGAACEMMENCGSDLVGDHGTFYNPRIMTVFRNLIQMFPVEMATILSKRTPS